MATPLALPAAGETGHDAVRRRNALPLGTAVAVAGLAMLFAGLIGAYLAAKSTQTGSWPPEDVEFDRYTATTLAITVLMASVVVEWAAYAIRRGFRGHSLFAFGLTVALGLAYLNGLAYLVGQFPFSPASHPYGTIAHALSGTAFLVGALAIGGLVLIWLRAIGHQLTTDNLQLLRATAILWHAAAASWIAVYYTMYITK